VSQEVARRELLAAIKALATQGQPTP